MEKEDTDMYCDSSEFKVSLYTGGQTWGQVYWKGLNRMKCCSCFELVEYW